MAAHLGWPVWLLKRLMPYSEFIMWQEYLDHEQSTPGKLEYYIAQLTAMVAQPYLPRGKSVSLKDFLNPVKFVRKGLQSANNQNNLNATKTLFFGGVGMIGKGKR